jgi:hypothetical protein
MFGPTSGFRVKQFQALALLDPEDAECLLREASKRAWGGSWYRSPLAWKIIALTFIFGLGPIVALSLFAPPVLTAGVWFRVLVAIVLAAYCLCFQTMLHRELSGQINRLLADRREVRT